MASMWQTGLQRLTSGLEPRARGKQTLAALMARAPRVASVVLGAAIAAQAAAIALSLSAEIGFGLHSAATGGKQARSRGGVRLADITAAHLFGIAPQAMTAANTTAASREPLVLSGIIATPDPHAGFAIIGASATRSRTIYVGSEAAPGVVLAEVYPQWIVLEGGGERRTLALPGHLHHALAEPGL